MRPRTYIIGDIRGSRSALVILGKAFELDLDVKAGLLVNSRTLGSRFDLSMDLMSGVMGAATSLARESSNHLPTESLRHVRSKFGAISVHSVKGIEVQVVGHLLLGLSRIIGYVKDLPRALGVVL